jgi:hypothetical protein
MGFFTCRKSATCDRRLYFPSEGRHDEDFFALNNWCLLCYVRDQFLSGQLVRLALKVMVQNVKDFMEVIIIYFL